MHRHSNFAHPVKYAASYPIEFSSIAALFNLSVPSLQTAVYSLAFASLFAVKCSLAYPEVIGSFFPHRFQHCINRCRNCLLKCKFMYFINKFVF